jgi:two-component system cell cycle sensor histidine kinase/response regulator CckA
MRANTRHIAKGVTGFACALLLFACINISTAIAAEDKKTVLYLNSYHNGYHWSDGLLDGVRTVLNNSRYKVDLQIEYMDAKKFDYDSISKDLFSLYQKKFAEETFDVIIISDNDALNFINQYRTSLFPGVPVVFCGINDLKQSDIAAGNITGVVELFDLVATLDVAKTLHPEKDHLVVLIDNSTAGRAIRRQVEKISDTANIDLDIEFWIQLSLPDAQSRVRKLPENSFLFIAPYYQTIDGHFFTSEEVSEAIYKHSSVPIYSAWEFMIGYGSVGGRVLSGVEHGKIAGEMAIKILSGTSIDEVPIVNEPGGIFLFDYAVMEKLGIKQSQLPPGSKIINSPEAIYSLSKELFWTIMISFILLLLALVSMLGAMIERRKVELKIKDQLAFQETLMDTIPQLVSWKDLNGKYLGANQAFADFFGTGDSQAVVGKTTKEIVNDTNYGDWSSEADSAVVETSKAFRKVRRQVGGPGDTENWIEVNKVPLIGQGGRLVGVLSTAENITKEQSLEQQLLQSQKMEAIGTLAGGISHDFNNILTSIINSTELAITDVPQDSQTEIDLNRVLKAARRGGSLVQQILSFSRPSTEGFQPTDLGRLVQEVVHLMESSTPANLHVTFLYDPKDNYYVLADHTQMHQAILNLTTNAYHALRIQGGNLTLALSRVEIEENTTSPGGKKEAPFIKLSATDDGPGIDNNIQDKIFDPFFSTKSKAEGTGLGLAVVHGIIKNHQGSIRVISGEGEGTTFEILLPEADFKGETRDDIVLADVTVGGHILFVEDDEDQLQTTPRLLEERGFTVTAHKSPTEAAKTAAGNPGLFDIIVSDFDMPGMSGAELAGKLPDLPVILVSGRDDAIIAASDYPNIHSVIIKPYSIQDIIDSIRNLKVKRQDNG